MGFGRNIEQWRVRVKMPDQCILALAKAKASSTEFSSSRRRETWITFVFVHHGFDEQRGLQTSKHIPVLRFVRPKIPPRRREQGPNQIADVRRLPFQLRKFLTWWMYHIVSKIRITVVRTQELVSCLQFRPKPAEVCIWNVG